MLGYPVGDGWLGAVAVRIENVIKDKGRAGRLGGDEFVVVITETANRTAISNLAARLISDLSAPYMVGDSQIIIGASIGIATGPHEGATSDDLLRHRSEERRVGKECVSTCRSRWSPSH